MVDVANPRMVGVYRRSDIFHSLVALGKVSNNFLHQIDELLLVIVFGRYQISWSAPRIVYPLKNQSFAHLGFAGFSSSPKEMVRPAVSATLLM